MSFVIEQFYLFFQGALVFQSVFFFLIWAATRRNDVLWYSLYLLTAALYFFINATGTFFKIEEAAVFESSWYSLLNIPIIIIENLFYLLFIKAFFYDIIASQKVKNILRLTLYSVPVLFFCFIIFRVTGISTYNLFYIVKLLSVIPAIFIAYIVIKNKLPYATLVANGLIFTITGTLVTVIMIILRNNDVHTMFTDYYPLLFIRLGILGDMFFYQFALLKKWRWQEKELALQQHQTKTEVERVRNEISRELHDDIGSTLSGINMYSHMAMTQSQSGDSKATVQSLQTIQQSAAEMVGKLKDIVWANNLKDGDTDAFFETLKDYVLMITKPAGIVPEFNFSATAETNRLSKEEKYHIYMICKEAVNNMVKHSGADSLAVSFEKKDTGLDITIADNGYGLKPGKNNAGNGLNNMRKRAEEIGAIFSLQSGATEGSKINLYLKITR